ncbi:hypothetical protein LXL04_003823 [Taraxacum kok-saghyz]
MLASQAPLSQLAQSRKLNNKHGVLRSICKHCGRGQYKCEKKDYGTTNLNNHLKKCKPYLAKLGGGQTELAFEHGDQNKLTSWRFDQKDTRKALAHMIVVDELPFRFVEGAGFKYYNSISQLLFKIPCRTTTTLDIYQLFDEENVKSLCGKVNSPRFPILSLMARDLFAIPVSTVASESVFITTGRILDPYRSSLTDKMIQNLIFTQDWLRGGISDNIGHEED